VLECAKWARMTIYQRYHGCQRKIRYGHKETAERAVLAMRAKQTRHEKLEAYECEYCEGWHIGHSRRRFRITISILPGEKRT